MWVSSFFLCIYLCAGQRKEVNFSGLKGKFQSSLYVWTRSALIVHVSFWTSLYMYQVNLEFSQDNGFFSGQWLILSKIYIFSIDDYCFWWFREFEEVFERKIFVHLTHTSGLYLHRVGDFSCRLILTKVFSAIFCAYAVWGDTTKQP